MFGCTRRGPAVALRDALPVRVAALAVACLLGLSLLSVSAAQAAGTSTTCQPYSSTPCLFPFPDNRLTKPDHGSATGLQLNLPQAAMPVNSCTRRSAPGRTTRTTASAPAARSCCTSRNSTRRRR